jgi:cell division protein ZapA
MKQIEVQIMGQSYLLGCPEGGDEQLLAAVQRVDAAMCKIRDGGKVRARDRIAVLAALNLAFDLAEIPAPAPSPTTPETTSVVAGATTVASAPGALSGTDHATLNSLLARLDTALNDDRRLL